MPKKRPSKLASKLGIVNAGPTLDKATSQPSGRGATGGGAGSARIDQPYRQAGMPPHQTNGEPSMSFDVNASEIMQNKIMNQDDKDWYKVLFKKMAKDFLKPRFTVNNPSPGKAGLRAEPGMDQGLNAGLDLSLKSCIVEVDNILTEPDDTDEKKKKKDKKNTDEVNAIATGNISGYTLPLGASNQNRKQRKRNAEVNARAYGGGKLVGKL